MSEDKRLDEVIRVRKRPNNFVMLDKTFLEDDRLSFKAKGILAYLLSKPDNWKVIVGNLVKYSKDGKSAVYARRAVPDSARCFEKARRACDQAHSCRGVADGRRASYEADRGGSFV